MTDTYVAVDHHGIDIAVIDDHEIIHDGIETWCAAAQPRIRVRSKYATPAAFLDDTSQPGVHKVDAVVLDLQFGDHTPDLGPLTSICQAGHRVVVYSQHADPALILDCLDVGAVTYLSKVEGRTHLIAALHAASTDSPYIGPTMAGAMSSDATSKRPHLSHREREVLLNWFQTESKGLVAQSLYITVGTIDTHLARIRTKYAAVGRPAPTKAALVARAIQDRLITPEEL